MKNSSELSTQLNWLWLLLSCAQKSSLGIDIRTSLPEASQIAEVYGYESLYAFSVFTGPKRAITFFPGLNTELLVMIGLWVELSLELVIAITLNGVGNAKARSSLSNLS